MAPPERRLVVHPGQRRRSPGQGLGGRRPGTSDHPRLSRPGPGGAAVNEFVERTIRLTWRDPKPSYDVVIIGGGGHGLSIAYHLAKRHGVTDMAVLDRGYIGSRNSGRNTTVIRPNYGIPESIRFYQRSLELYQRLEEETSRWIMDAVMCLILIVRCEAGMRGEKRSALLNPAAGAETMFLTTDEIAELVPLIDRTGGGNGYPVLGASYHPKAATARHNRVVWALAE